MATILFLAANPAATSRLALDEEARGIEHELRLARHRDAFSVRTLWAPRPLDLLRSLNEERPGIVHFAGHGLGGAGIVLPDDEGGDMVVAGDALRRLFERFPQSVRLVVLNACSSLAQCDDIKQAIGCAIGMNAAMDDVAARRFAEAFYGGLGAACSVKAAFEQAVALLGIYADAKSEARDVRSPTRAGPSSASVPILCCRAEVDPDRIVFVADGSGAAPPIAAPFVPDGTAVVRAAVRALDGIDERERVLAVVTLARTRGDAAREALGQALQHPIRSVRIAAARQSPDHADPRVLRGLIEALHEEHTERSGGDRSHDAFRQLHIWLHAMGAAAAPALVSALDGSPLLSEPRFREVAWALAQILGKQGDPVAGTLLRDLTTHVEPSVRAGAIDALGAIGDPSAAPAVRVRLGDDHESVRAAAAACLGRLRDTASIADLVRLLEGDTRRVRTAAAESLEKLAARAAIPALTRALDDPDKDVCVAAAAALASTGAPAGLAFLRPLLTADSDEIGPRDRAIMLALLRHGDTDAISKTERRILAYRRGELSELVFEALADLGAAGHAALIRILDRAEPSGRAAECASKALTGVATLEAEAVLRRWRLRR